MLSCSMNESHKLRKEMCIRLKEKSTFTHTQLLNLGDERSLLLYDSFILFIASHFCLLLHHLAIVLFGILNK